jgi:hypothetical protein
MDLGRGRRGDCEQAWKDDLHSTTFLLVGVPRLLVDIIAARAARAGDVSVAAAVDRADAVDALRRTSASLVISGDPDEALVSELLHSRSGVGVVTVTGDGSAGTLHRLLPHRTALGELWLERLIGDDTTKGAPPCQ